MAAIDCSTPANILTFRVNSDCSLTGPLSTQTLFGAVALQFSPTNNCLAVIAGRSTQVTCYSFNPTNCTISSPQTIPGLGFFPTQAAFSPDGNCLAGSFQGTDAAPSTGILEIYSINPNNCAPTLVQSCTPNSTDETGRSEGWSPNGTCLYFVTSANIYAYTRNCALSVTKCCPECISSCGKVEYKIRVKNTGKLALSNLQASDLLPECLTFICGKARGGLSAQKGRA